jgi:hypothetical protein
LVKNLGWKKQNELLQEVIKKLQEQINATNALGDSAPGVPGRLSYAQMGREDFWATSREGL